MRFLLPYFGTAALQRDCSLRTVYANNKKVLHNFNSFEKSFIKVKVNKIKTLPAFPGVLHPVRGA
jgi:hypothetical protein